MNALLLLLAVVAIVYFFGKSNKTSRKQTTINFNSRKHFALIIGYIIFLLAVLVTSEFVERQYPTSSSSGELTEVDFTELHYNLSIGEVDEVINSPQFIEKRTHQIGNTLNIQNEYDGTYIYIERKSTDDDIVEELIFKPMLQINGHDLSDKVKVAKPIWQDGLITLPKQPLTDIRYAQFNDAILLNQLTYTESRSSSYRGYGTRSLVVYLLVPEGVEIEVSSESTIQYVSD